MKAIKIFNTNKINIFDIYMNVILIMPITTMLQNKIEIINKIVFIAIFFLQVCLLLKYKIKKKYAVLLFVAVIVYLIGLINTKNLKFDNNIIYYINWIMYVCLISTNKENVIKWIEKSKNNIYMVIWIWTIAVMFSIFLPSSYYIKEGGGRYFGSYMGSIFRLGPTALFIATLTIVCISFYQDKKAILFMIVPLYCAFMGSSRTYFIIIALVAIIGLYLISKDRKQFLKILFPCILLGIIIYGGTSISEKVEFTRDKKQYGDFWYRITSSRSVLWENIINDFNRNLTVFEKMLGGGYGFSTNAVGHYAHNDFIEILVTHGYMGLIIYIISIRYIISGILKNTAKIFVIVCTFIWAFNAMFNMFYYYTCAALSFPLLLVSLECYTQKKDKTYRKEKIYENTNHKTFSEQNELGII